MRDGDVILWFNFRADRARQLSQAFLLKDFNGFDREVPAAVHYVTLTEYDDTYLSPIVFPPQIARDHPRRSGEPRGLKQLRIAETEKYPHVTYLLQRRRRETVSRRGSQDRSVTEGRADLRSTSRR